MGWRGKDMIVDTFSNLEKYKESLPQLLLVKKFIDDHMHEENMECCKYLIDDENVFALVQEYVTKNSKEIRWESHRKYIDVQFILSGNENIGYSRCEALKLMEDFSEGKDIAFYKSPKTYTQITLSEGMFAIFYPGEAHLPCCISETPSNVKKIVFKIKKT